MDINDFFRGFFGFPRIDRSDFENRSFGPWGEDFTSNNEENSESSGNQRHTDLFDELEDMINNMVTIRTGFLDMPNFEVSENTSNPRDMMLKSDSCNNCENSAQNTKLPVLQINKLDTGAVGDAFFISPETNLLKETPQNISFRRSQTKIVRSSDGVVEEKWSSTDSAGNTSTTICKSIGDQSYKIMTQTDKNGLVEKKEDFVNLDEKDIPEFESKFGRFRNPMAAPPQPQTNEEFTLNSPPGDPKYLSRFKRFFGAP